MQQPHIDRLIRSARKSIGLCVTHEGLLEVRAPKRAANAAIEAAVREKAGWIRQKQAESLARSARFPQLQYTEGESIPFMGKNLLLHYSANAKKTFATGGVLFVPEKKKEAPGEAVRAWYKAQARALFTARLDHFANIMGVAYGRLRLSSAGSRWGSCSPAGDINLVWRLVAAPPEQIDYVAVHELAHLKRRDHSAAFWDEVGRMLPDYRERRRALKDCAPLLTAL